MKGLMARTRFTPKVVHPPAGSPTAPRQSWSMTASHVAPREARKAVTSYAVLIDLPPQLRDDVLLCVSEAVTNVVSHAYPDLDSEGSVQIEASVDGDLRISVSDQGSGFAVHAGGKDGGMGLPIITKLTRSFHIRTTATGAGTEVVMRFELPPS
jgi:anti-sigma regulatory factor (Ser/Thr protein kinase)